ncbi:MAG TPA: DUF6279 family lipoprotein [Oxalicibacterium sp.]|jgi:hypothetical protein|nr:DUF6279 family lipoprotein [Oxalicibacterium sp.]
MENFSMRPFLILFKRLLIAGLAAALLACSAARIGYSNGETISYWWLNSYVDFESEQKPWVKSHIDELFAWHRKTQLQQYVKLISRLQRADYSAITKADLLADYQEGRKSVNTIVDRAAPELADLALSLTPEQIDNIDKKLDKNNDKFRKDYLRGSVQDRQEFRYKRMMKQAEYWFGNFSHEQEQRLRALSDARPLNNELVMADRLLRQQKMIELLKKIQAQKPSKEATEQMIRQYIVAAMDHFGNQQYRTFFDQSDEANAALVAEMLHMATPEQRRHFINTLQDWVSDFNRLMAKADS